MVGTEASVPVRVPISHDGDVVRDQSFQGSPIIGDVRFVEEVHDVDYAEGEEEDVRIGGMASYERVALALHLADEVAFDGVDILARPVMDDGRLSFFVYPHLEPLLHLNVTPASHSYQQRRHLHQSINLLYLLLVLH